MRFEERHGTIYLIDEFDNIIRGYQKLVFCFDTETGTLHKFGEKEVVAKWFHKTVQKLTSAGMNNEAKALVILDSDQCWDPEVINRFLNTSGYIGTWWSKQEMKKLENE